MQRFLFTIIIFLCSTFFIIAQSSGGNHSQQLPITLENGIVYIGGLSEKDWFPDDAANPIKVIFSIIKYGNCDPRDLMWYSSSFINDNYEVKTHNVFFKDGSIAYSYSEYFTETSYKSSLARISSMK